MTWLTAHWHLAAGSGLVAALLVLWQRGAFRSFIHLCSTLRAAYRDQERADAIKKCADCEAQLGDYKTALRARLLTDDARDEIHRADVADKKQLSLLVVRLKERLIENKIAFDDLL